MTELYAPFTRQGAPLFFVDGASAEMTKYAANAFLATKISFMNEMANLSEQRRRQCRRHPRRPRR
jgi:UDPglucose 6-dehydrogenase